NLSQITKPQETQWTTAYTTNLSHLSGTSPTIACATCTCAVNTVTLSCPWWYCADWTPCWSQQKKPYWKRSATRRKKCRPPSWTKSRLKKPPATCSTTCPNGRSPACTTPPPTTAKFY